MTAAFDVEASEIVPAKRARKRTVSVTRLSKREIAFARAEYGAEAARIAQEKPRTYAECEARGLGLVRPCPYISCAHHLYLDVDERNGSITINFPDREPTEIPETCALGAASRHEGGLTLDQVASIVNLTRERIRQYEVRCVATLRRELAARGTPEDYQGPVRCTP